MLIRADGSEEQTGTDPESACRVKKPSIAAVAGASTSEEVCPWESVQPEHRSRKNSIQMDSGSSSSDVSVAITTDVSDRLRRTCGLTQQNTLDGSLASRKLSANTYMEPRRASVSVPITGSDSIRRNVTSSFEDSNVSSSEASAPPQPSSALVNRSDTDNNNKSEEATSSKTLDKSESLVKTCSASGSNAPIISVSTVTDESVENPSEFYEEEKSIAEAAAGRSSSSQPLAPLAEPDSESPASEQPPETKAGEGEARNSDVCPWEDE